MIKTHQCPDNSPMHQLIISRSAIVGATSKIGKAYRRLLTGDQPTTNCQTRIGDRVEVGEFCIVGRGSHIAEDCVLDDFTKIECDVEIGRRTLITYGAQVCNDVYIGEECIIGGFVGERSWIGDRCRVFGQIVHEQHQAHLSWDSDAAVESAAVIEEEAFVGMGACIVGPVRIGARAFVAAGAVVTRDVPARNIAIGVNRVIPVAEWKGPLRKSAFFGR